MSWFNASHLSSFAKQALTSAQKSIDRVLDIKEEDQWGDTVVMPYEDVTLPGKLSLSGGWGLTQWEAPPEEKTTTPPPSSEAITTPVTRTVVDESENFFSAFLPPGDVQGVTKAQVVSVPPTKSQRRPQEKNKKNKEAVVQKEEETSAPVDKSHEDQTVAESQPLELDSSPATPYADAVVLEPVVCPASSPGDLLSDSDSKTSSVKTDVGPTIDLKTEQSLQASSELEVEQDTTDSSEPSAVISEPKSSTPSDTSSHPSSKEGLIEHKDSKVEDRQNDTPSPPVSAFSSGTSTTSDIEVLDHESVLSESSASSRQETGEGKAGLHLMQGSFQLLTASTCGDFHRLEDYSKLTESCGSSSDAFERIDSFSVQSLDSRSVSEVNSDDEIPGSRTLASVTAGPAPLTVSSAVCQKQEDGVMVEAGEEEEKEEEEEGFTETMRERSLDEMEERKNEANGTIFKELLQTPNFRITVVEESDTVELCGALKNIVAVGAGFCDGLGFGDNTKAAVIRLGLMEMVAFAKLFCKGSVSSTTFLESCGVADLITTCYGGRNRKVAEAFAKTSKSITELEAEMLNGQKLQGPQTSAEVYKLLQKRDMVNKFPLFSAVYQICFEGKEVKEFITCLQNHPEHM